MSKPFNLIEFEEPPTPPALLYKYLSPDRIGNVLENRTVRFTQLLNTNDSFEVRATFRQFAGPRFIQMMEKFVRDKITEDHINKKLSSKLAEIGLGHLPLPLAKTLFKNKIGKDITEYMKDEIKSRLPSIQGALNKYKKPEEFLNELGASLLCFSLSETYSSAPMWAHYGANHSGFAIEFDTSNGWFQQNKDTTKSRLQKVNYLDGQLDEPLDDPNAAFISKTLDWSYEKEWRVYCGIGDAERTLGSAADPIHLTSFPVDAVKSIIVGQKAADDTVAAIKDVARRRYAHSKLLRASANRTTHSYDLQPL